MYVCIEYPKVPNFTNKFGVFIGKSIDQLNIQKQMLLYVCSECEIFDVLQLAHK